MLTSHSITNFELFISLWRALDVFFLKLNLDVFKFLLCWLAKISPATVVHFHVKILRVGTFIFWIETVSMLSYSYLNPLLSSLSHHLPICPAPQPYNWVPITGPILHGPIKFSIHLFSGRQLARNVRPSGILGASVFLGESVLLQGIKAVRCYDAPAAVGTIWPIKTEDVCFTFKLYNWDNTLWP